MKLDLAKLGLFLRTCLFYGWYGVGKTHFCATFPRVAWFGAPREGGFETLKDMDPAALYESNRPVDAYGVESIKELVEHLNRDVLPKVQRGDIQTIVFELSIYSDDLIRARASEQSWHKYVDLENHIIHWDQAFKKIPGLRIVYNTLAAGEEDPKKPGSIVIAGRALPRKLPALCDTVGYLRAETVNGAVERILHLTPYGQFQARTRYHNRLGVSQLKNPSYRALELIALKQAHVDTDGTLIMEPPPADAGGLPPLPPLKAV